MIKLLLYQHYNYSFKLIDNMVDYSKWDHIDVSDDEEDLSNKPKVTKLNGGRVQIGSSGAVVYDNSSEKTTRIELANSPSNSKPSIVSSADMNLMCKNGASLDQFNWSQNRIEVILYIKCQIEVISKNLVVKLVSGKHLEVIDKSNSNVLFTNTLKYTIKIDDEFLDEQSNIIDWEIRSYNNEKYIVISMCKLSPIPNAVFWWNQVFIDDVQIIDVTQIQGRSAPSDGSKSQDKDKQIADEHGLNIAAQNVWDEAHKLFFEKIKSKEKITIDT